LPERITEVALGLAYGVRPDASAQGD
jgi:hypothetical protein